MKKAIKISNYLKKNIEDDLLMNELKEIGHKMNKQFNLNDDKLNQAIKRYRQRYK